MDDLEKQLGAYGARAADEVEPVTADAARDRAAVGAEGVAAGPGAAVSGSEGSAEVVLDGSDGEQRTRRHTVLAVAAVVLVLALIGGALALRDDEPNDLVTAPGPAGGPTFGYGPGWHDLDPGPLEGRVGAAVAWTGIELIVVGGTRPDPSDSPPGISPALKDGAAYNPVTRTWRSIPDLPARGAPEDGPEVGGQLEAVWTGTELLVVEVSPETLTSLPGQNSRSVAAFDPSTDTWRATSTWTEGELMYVGAADFALHWTGSELLFADALMAYDPATDEFRELTTPADKDSAATGQEETWFELLAPEHQRRSVWTGDELLLFGAYAADDGVTIALDPETLERRRLEPRPGIPPAASGPLDHLGDAVWTGSSMVDVNGRDEVAVFDPSSEGGWRLGELPAASDGAGCAPVAHVVAAHVVVDRCDSLFESVGDGWVRVGDGRASEASQVSTGEVILEWTGHRLVQRGSNPPVSDFSRRSLRIWVPDAAVPLTTTSTSPDVTGSVPTSESTTTSQVPPPSTAVPPPSAPERPAPVEWEWYGLTKDEAIAKAEAEDRLWRIVREDEEGFVLTADVRPGRLNFSIDDGMVTYALIEGPDGGMAEGVVDLGDTPYLGRTEEQAFVAADADGLVARVIVRDGLAQDREDDLRPDRLNFVVVDDRVVAVQRF